MQQEQKIVEQKINLKNSIRIEESKSEDVSPKVNLNIKSSGTVFVKENTGQIKDFYKISSCIGRGKLFKK